MSLTFERIRLRNGQTYKFSGVLGNVKLLNGDTVKVDNEGSAQGSNQTTQTIQRAGIATAVGAIIGAIAGGGKGAAIGGIIGIPHSLGGHHWLSEWLSPVITHHAASPDHATEYMLMGITVVGVLISIGIAYNRYVGKAHVPAEETAERSSLAGLSYNKFYIDELYDAIIRKPLDAMSGFFYRVMDTKIIDGIVNGLGWGTNEASKSLRLIQTGNVGFYIFMMVVGIISMLLYTYLSI